MFDSADFDEQNSSEPRRSRKRKLEAPLSVEHAQKLLKTDERSALELDLVSPFYDYNDLWNRLIPFHVFLTDNALPSPPSEGKTS
jgi:hypothetical protein